MNEEAIRVPAKHTFLKKKSIMSSYWDRDDSDTETSPAPKPVLEPALLQHLKNHPVLKPAKVLAYANSSSQLMRTKLVLALQRTQNAAGLTKLATHSRVAEEIGKEEIEQAMENLVHVTPPEVKLDTSSYTDPNVKVLKSILKGKDTLRKSKHARFASQNSLVQTLKLHYEIENLSFSLKPAETRITTDIVAMDWEYSPTLESPEINLKENQMEIERAQHFF